MLPGLSHFGQNDPTNGLYQFVNGLLVAERSLEQTFTFDVLETVQTYHFLPLFDVQMWSLIVQVERMWPDL